MYRDKNSIGSRIVRSVVSRITPIKPNANHGMVIFLLPPSAEGFLMKRASTMSTGASIITLIILVIGAVPAMPSASVGSIAFPAPATFATSCRVLPV